MKNSLYRHGINIENKFEFNNKIYSVYDILNELHILPIHLLNYNYLLYTEDYLNTKKKEIEDFIHAFKSVYNTCVYEFILQYIKYIEETYNISFFGYFNL